MTDKQNEALVVAATALVNRFGSIKIEDLTNKIHPELKGVRKTTLIKELKALENNYFKVEDDILKISYFTELYDRTSSILASKEEYEPWKIITWDDIKEYSDLHKFPLSETAEQFFNYCLKINPKMKYAKDIFSFRLSNYVNTHDFIYLASLNRFILQPFELPCYNQELLDIAYEACKSQTSWLKAGKSENERIKYAWKDRADKSVERFTDEMKSSINDISLSCVNFYGIVPIRKLKKIISTYHREWKITSEELKTYLSCFTEESGLFTFDKYIGTKDLYTWVYDYFKEETLASIDQAGFANYQKSKSDYKNVTTFSTNTILEYIVQQLVNDQNGKPFQVPTEKELLQWKTKSYCRPTTGYKDFEELYVKENGFYSNNLDKFREIFNTYSNMVGDNVTSILGDFFKAIKVDGDKSTVNKTAKSRLMQISQAAFANAPRWRHNGSSSIEILTIGNDDK
jgi:hypothetical protein